MSWRNDRKCADSIKNVLQIENLCYTILRLRVKTGKLLEKIDNEFGINIE